MPDDIDRIVDQYTPHLLPEFRPVARKLIEAGIRFERNRVVALIQPPEPPVATPRRERPVANAGSSEYGAVSKAVAGALKAICEDSPEEGDVRAADIHDFLSAAGSDISLGQVRAALKLLHTNGEAVRTGRGAYLYREVAGSSPAGGENPDASASGQSALAAE
jgi:hypothetical protein